MNQECSGIVVSLASQYIDYLEENMRNWDKAFFRFYIDEGSNYGVTASYIVDGKVTLIGSIDHNDLYSRIRKEFFLLWKKLRTHDKNFVASLLIVDFNFNFNVLFEYEDKERWVISKINSDGIPEGYDKYSELEENLSKFKKPKGFLRKIFNKKK